MFFAKKVKDRSFWKIIRYSKKDLNKLTKPIQDQNITYQQTKNDCKIAMITIKRKQRKKTTNYIKRYNANKKYTKTIQKTVNQYSWKDTYNQVIHKVVWQLDLCSKYSILN